MSLNTQMKAFKRSFEASAAPSVLAAFHRAEMALRQSDILERSLKAGNSMPEFALPDTRGHAVALAGLLLRGPVVVSFYRGDWCDYCAMELAALTAIHDRVNDLGAALIAISPQAPETRIRFHGAEPPFPLLFDAEAKVTRRCGIAFTLSDELREIYTGAGLRPSVDGRDDWLLPLPATYVVDWTGEIVLSYVDTDYTNRLEPCDIIMVLSHLARRTESGRLPRVRKAGSKDATPRSTSK